MSSEVILSAASLEKRYALAAAPHRALLRALLGRPEPVGAAALSDVSLVIRRGESVGVLGRNGAGKSTLLGLLSGAITPTRGVVGRRGKVAAVLQLTGMFQADLSARENLEIYFAAAGLSGAAARRALSHAEEFADIGKYFDMPVFTYSSGMLARAAFSGALSLEADTMILDEVLAVGDLSFRRRCAAALRDMRRAGRSFLIVSQTPAALMHLCERGLVLEKGRLLFDGDIAQAASAYAEVRADADARRKAGVARARATGPREDTPVALRGVAHRAVAIPGGDVLAIDVRLDGLPRGREISAEAVILHPRGAAVTKLWATGVVEPDGALLLTFEMAHRLVNGAYNVDLNVLAPEPLWRMPAAFRLDIGDRRPARGLIDIGLDAQLKIAEGHTGSDA